jgi:hypothetical protein
MRRTLTAVGGRVEREINVIAVEQVERRYSQRLWELNQAIANELSDDTAEMGEALVERRAVRAAMAELSGLLEHLRGG